MAYEITGSLIDIVLEQDEKHHGPLLAQIVEHLSGEYLERRGLIQQTARQLAGKWGPPWRPFQDFEATRWISKNA